MESLCCMNGPFSPRVHSAVGSFCPTTSLKMIIGIGLMSFTGAWVSGEEGSGVTSLPFQSGPRRDENTIVFTLLSEISDDSVP